MKTRRRLLSQLNLVPSLFGLGLRVWLITSLDFSFEQTLQWRRSSQGHPVFVRVRIARRSALHGSDSRPSESGRRDTGPEQEHTLPETGAEGGRGNTQLKLIKFSPEEISVKLIFHNAICISVTKTKSVLDNHFGVLSLVTGR